jgi:hypothetical protein
VALLRTTRKKRSRAVHRAVRHSVIEP